MSYKYLLLCTIQSQLLWTAATSQPVKSITDKAKQKVPKYLKMIVEVDSSAGKLQLNVPLSYTEPFTGKTIGQLADETIEKGLPLLLVHAACTSRDGKTDRKILDLRALMRTYQTWNESILSSGSQTFDMKPIEKMIFSSTNRYLHSIKKPCHAFLNTASSIICSTYKPIGEYEIDLIITGSKQPITLKSASLSSLALLWEFTGNLAAILALDTVYQKFSQHPNVPIEMCTAIKESQKRLRASFPAAFAVASEN